MVQIHFIEACEVLGFDSGEDQEILFEKKISDALGVPPELAADVSEIFSYLTESVGDDMSVAFCYLDKVLYARIYDGEKYLFPLPFMLTDDADSHGACINLASYAVKELIPLIITDVPRDEINFICSVFPHIDAFTYEDDDDSFFVKVNNECDMLDSPPTVEHDGIVLCEITESDKEKYALLCRDRELNKYWGYDVDCDNPDGNADFYIDVANREFRDGVAIAMAIREADEFVGEATIYGFDYRGSASIAVRVLPSFHSRGIGSRATKALILLAKDIGLSRITAEIMNQNANSIKMTSKYMEIEKQTDCKTYFTLSLN